MGSAAALGALVAVARYKPGWRFRLESGPTSAGSCWAGGWDPAPLTAGSSVVPAFAWPVFLVVCIRAEDTSEPGRMVLLEHRFMVPDDPRQPWHRWLLECIHRVEIHEMCEAFAVGSARPFFPEHGPGAGPAMYEITDRGLPEPGYLEP